MVVTHAARGPSAFGRGPRARFMVAIVLGVLLVGCVERGQESYPSKDAGESHNVMLWEKRWPELEFHVYYQEGVRPEQRSLDVLIETAREVTHRTEVRLVGPTVFEGFPSYRNYTWSQSEWDRVFDEMAGPALQRSLTEEGHARVTILYLNGKKDGEAAVGLEHAGAIILFPNRWRGELIPGPQTSEHAAGSWQTERTVLVHEFGHVMGLVSCGIPMVRNHGSTQSLCHSSNDRSVMAGGVDAISPRLDAVVDMGWLPYKFDADDLADLEAFRNSPKNVAREGRR